MFWWCAGGFDVEEEAAHVNESDVAWGVGRSPKGRFEVHEKLISEAMLRAEARE